MSSEGSPKGNKIIEFNDGKLTVTVDGNSTVLSDVQTAAFFDRPDTPQYMYTVYLIRNKPEDAKKWIELKLLEVEFIRAYFDLKKKEQEEE